jgi:hypothetical protein
MMQRCDQTIYTCLRFDNYRNLGGQGIGIQHDLAEAITTAQNLGADVVKVGMDLIRPPPIAASRFHPDVMAQLKSVASRLKQMAPTTEAAGVKKETVERSIKYCREILGIKKDNTH